MYDRFNGNWPENYIKAELIFCHKELKRWSKKRNNKNRLKVLKKRTKFHKLWNLYS